jgi:hypothetical protein
MLAGLGDHVMRNLGIVALGTLTRNQQAAPPYQGRRGLI